MRNPNSWQIIDYNCHFCSFLFLLIPIFTILQAATVLFSTIDWSYYEYIWMYMCLYILYAEMESCIYTIFCLVSFFFVDKHIHFFLVIPKRWIAGYMLQFYKITCQTFSRGSLTKECIYTLWYIVLWLKWSRTIYVNIYKFQKHSVWCEGKPILDRNIQYDTFISNLKACERHITYRYGYLLTQQ